MQYKGSKNNNATNNFTGVTVIINPIAVIQFFEAIYIGTFEYLFAAYFKDSGLLKLVSMYFEIVKTNS